MAQFKATLQKFDSNLWGFHLPVPSTIADNFIEGNDRRIICWINGKLRMQNALMPYSEGYFLLINKDLVKKLDLSVGKEVKLKLE